MNKLAVVPRFFPRQSAGVALCFLPLLLGLSCGRSQSPTAPGMPELAGFALTLMSPVAAGQPIDLKIEA